MSVQRTLCLIVGSALLLGCAQQPTVPVAETATNTKAERESGRLQRHLFEGDTAQRAGRLEDALMHYLLAEQILTSAAGYPPGLMGDEVLWRIAFVHEAAGRWLEASEAWDRAARRADRGGENLNRLGWARLKLEQHVPAREAFAAALVHDARHIRARLGMALTCEALGEWGLAAQYLEEVLQLEPRLPTARLARARVALRQGDLTTARAHLRTQLAEGAPAETYGLLGDVLAHQGDYAKALQAYVKHLPLHESWARLGRQAMQTRDYLRAIHYFERAAKESPAYREEWQKQRAVAEELLQARQAVQP